jgi:4-hydroxy-3-methylbut-2-en-1-yl diphosphate reductase
MDIKINLAKSAGFCFGVKRAINTAFTAVATGEMIEMLGDIVHNRDVVEKIRKAGIKKISRLSVGKNKALLIRAHGAPAQTFIKAKKLGYKIIDATCPMVKEIHKIAKGMEDEGRKIIIIGDKKHDEVKGIVGQLRHKALLIDSSGALPLAKLKTVKKAGLVTQSTQNLDKVLKIAETLKKIILDLKFINTICNPTRTKQKEIKEMPLNNSLVIVIGSKKSANTRRLYEISRSLNKKTYLIQSSRQIKKEWFKNAQSVGITAGASTPDETTNGVIEKIKTL